MTRSTTEQTDAGMPNDTLHDRAEAALRETDTDAKAAQVAALHADWRAGGLSREAGPVPALHEPGRPARPLLVPPAEVPWRNPKTAAGRAALLHALAHIEFNAINLALDAVFRFRDLPDDFYGDWLRVADEEALHFRLLREHLRAGGHDYGDFPAHDGLWEMAVKTAHDPLTRMALVPRLLEARGLDASPTLVAKFRRAGDARAVEILEAILRDEVGHVRIGNRWYAHLCAQRGLDPVTTFRALLKEYDAPPLRPPFHLDARRAAGFTEEEIDWLAALPER
jgi:uncharacterized ferritin-like protein (DUF455 family)